jgi:hypothetical protein
LSFRLLGSGVAVDALGSVIWANEGRHGIQFTNVGAQSQESIRSYILELERRLGRGVSGPILFMESFESEPELVFKLSDQNEFYCSACGSTVASIGNGRFVIGGIPGLIAAFKEHVERYHPTQS